MKHNTIKLSAIIVIALAQLAFGQITYKTVITSDGFMGMGAFKSTTKTFLVDHAQRTETSMKFTGALMKHFSPKGKEISIIRLDKELMWNIDESKKRYHEQTFAELKEMMNQAGDYQSQQMPENHENNEDYEADYEWQKPKVKVKDLKKSKEINGFKCQHYLATVTTIGTHKETGTKDTMVFSSDLWNSKKVTKKMEQVQVFNKKYMKAIGFDMPENMGLAMMSGMYKDQMQTLGDKINKLEGYPIINDMTLSITKNAISDNEESAATEESDEGVSLRDIQKNFGGLLGKKLLKDAAKKKKSTKNTKKKSSLAELFHMKSEVLSITEGSIADNMFEVKKGYKLKK